MTKTPTPTISIAAREETLSEALSAAIEPAEAERWLAVPAVYLPEVVTVTGDDGAVVAALLVTHRPHTAYRKIARAWWSDPTALDAAVSALEAESRAVGGIATLKWEDADGTLAEHALRNGFTPLAPPIRSGAGTSVTAGYRRDLVEIARQQVPYYRQTTEYSCGPVALLMAQAAQTRETITRDVELRLWRQAAHLPGCGPIALAVNTDLGVFRPEVYISTDQPILGEHLVSDMELEVRELFDGEDTRRAGELGIPIHHRLFALDEIARSVQAGAPVLLLIDELYFHDDTCSHWVTAHAFGEGYFLLNDPWIDAAHGESWVDAGDLPVAAADLELVAAWGDPAFRALVVLNPVVGAEA